MIVTKNIMADRIYQLRELMFHIFFPSITFFRLEAIELLSYQARHGTKYCTLNKVNCKRTLAPLLVYTCLLFLITKNQLKTLGFFQIFIRNYLVKINKTLLRPEKNDFEAKKIFYRSIYYYNIHYCL